jgi:integrase/recombinase XerD
MSTELATKGPGTGLTLAITDALKAEWLDYERANGASDNTLAAYRKGLDTFESWLDKQGLNLAYVTPVDVVAFKSDLAGQYKAQTVNLRLVAVRSFYRFAVTTGLALANPASEVKGVKRTKAKTHKRGALTNGEVLGVLETCDLETPEGIRDRAILSLMAYCGLRSVEIHRANIGDLRTRGDRLTLAVQGKGRADKDEQVVIPLHQESIIRAWVSVLSGLDYADHDKGAPLFVSFSKRSRGGRLVLRSIRGMVKERYAQAGVVGDDKSTHSLRHSAITNAIRRGATPMQVQSMARHQSFDTTLGYYHEVSRLDDPAEDLIEYRVGE